MTVSTSTNNVVYRGNGATTSFAVPFKVLDEDHLVVRKRDYDSGEIVSTYIGTDYSYSGIGDSAGTLTLAGEALSSDYQIVIERIVPYTQELDIVNAGGFYPETVEEQLDLIAMGMQQIADNADRAFKVAVGDQGVELPSASGRANKYLYFDETGTLDVTGTALALVEFVQQGADAVSRSTLSKMQEAPLSPEDFGAVGDGVTDDHDAFVKLAIVAEALGICDIKLRKGAHYRVGRQTANALADDGHTYRRRGDDAFAVSGMTYLKIDFNGARITWNDGLYFGRFDEDMNVLPGVSTERTELAYIGRMFRIEDTEIVRLVGGICDGNGSNVVLGGEYGDVDWQVPAYLVDCTGCVDVVWEQMRCFNSPLDGFHYSVAAAAGDDAYPFVMRNCRTKGCARNNITIGGGNQILLDNVESCDAGFVAHVDGPDVGGTGFGSNPKSCLDIENESGEPLRNVTLRNVRLISSTNSNTCLVADSGDIEGVTVINSRLVGLIYTSKKRFLMRDVRFNGAFASLTGAFPNPGDNPQLLNCTMSDENAEGWTMPVSQSTFITGSILSAGIIIRDGSLVISQTLPIFAYIDMQGTALYFTRNTDTLASGEIGITLAGDERTIFKPRIIVTNIEAAKAPASPYIFSTNGDEQIESTIVALDADKLVWPTAVSGYFHTVGASTEARKIIQQAVVADPAGGATVDAESRTAIAAIIDKLQAAGVMS